MKIILSTVLLMFAITTTAATLHGNSYLVEIDGSNCSIGTYACDVIDGAVDASIILSFDSLDYMSDPSTGTDYIFSLNNLSVLIETHDGVVESFFADSVSGSLTNLLSSKTAWFFTDYFQEDRPAKGIYWNLIGWFSLFGQPIPVEALSDWSIADLSAINSQRSFVYLDDKSFDFDVLSITAVPLPAGVSLFGSAIAGLICFRTKLA